MTKFTYRLTAAAALLATSLYVSANEANIRSTLPTLLIGNPTLDQVEKSPITGLWAVRIGSTVLFTDATGTKLIEGNQLIDLKTRRNYTQELLANALSVPFEKLPLKDALITHRSGDGSRKVAVFADPNCSFCKRYEPKLLGLQNATVYTFIVPALGQKSEDMARAIECAPEPVKAWNDWMLRGVRPADPAPSCVADAAQRNKSFATANHINSTPTSFFLSGARIPGDMTANVLNAELDKSQQPLSQR